MFGRKEKKIEWNSKTNEKGVGYTFWRKCVYSSYRHWRKWMKWWRFRWWRYFSLIETFEQRGWYVVQMYSLWCLSWTRLDCKADWMQWNVHMPLSCQQRPTDVIEQYWFTAINWNSLCQKHVKLAFVLNTWSKEVGYFCCSFHYVFRVTDHVYYAVLFDRHFNETEQWHNWLGLCITIQIPLFFFQSH
jgi:hypothetical protein